MSCNFMNFHDIFPTKWSFIIFILYITLFVNQGWLVTASQDTDNKYNYNTTLAVLCTEVIKLTVCALIYSFCHSFCSLIVETRNNIKVAALYFVPASLYCIYNNLTYINLSTFDPTTYYMVLQLRVVATGVVFQLIFKKELSAKQWISLIMLTFGCMIKQINFGDVPVSDTQVAGVSEEPYMNKQLGVSFSLGSLLLVAQVLCSCLGGVYNEYLLKHHSSEVNLYLQNIFGYADSIICIFILLVFQGNLQDIFSYNTVEQFFNYRVMLVVFNNAAIGIVTSFFLRYLNSILKTFASALELVFTMVISRLLFSIPIYMNTIISVFVVIAATITYSQNPVINVKTSKGEKSLGV
uniref:Putative cmp-sialic acid transporter n=1 Tax=Triatoma infestans TaxID=30076 RepID=A0A023F015_TRIIF